MKNKKACPEQSRRVKIAIFVSTRGTSLMPIIKAIKVGKLKGVEISFVLSNKKDCLAMKRAERAGIKTIWVDPKDKLREEYDQECLRYLKQYQVDLVLLIGYMRIISPILVKAYQWRIINCHPSLLPAFADGMDKGVHQEILNYGCKVTGDTVHFITEDTDTGPIILQQAVEIKEDETVDSLKKKVQKVEAPLLIKSIELFRDKKLKVVGRKVKIL